MHNPGDFLGDHYRILEVLSGGMGEVFICELIEDGQSKPGPDGRGEPLHLAMKTFQRRYFFDNAVRLSFIREATIWLRLSGLPHVMPIFGIESIGDRPFLQMPVVTPGPLGERSIGDLLKRGALAPESALSYAWHLALALRQAAARIEGLVHGDIKPSNILLMYGKAFLSDFGLVSAVSLGRQDHRLEGTWSYRAPELWADKSRGYTVASDVYAFGCLVYEMLAGQTPFLEKDHDRDAWAAAHINKLPAPLVLYPKESLSAAIMQLAIACLAKEPSARPQDFAEVLDRINLIYEEYDPVAHFQIMYEAHKGQIAFNEMASWGLKERIRSLLELGEPQSALDELDAINPDKYDAVLWLRRGTALSLLDRDEEALPCFERGLAGELSPYDRVNCQVEYALSLKRLNRFEEARAIYEHLMTKVSDEQLPLVVANLATVYIKQNKGEEAVRLLEPFVRRVPDFAPAWANLGIAYEMVGRYEDAERAFGHALVLAPQDGKIRVMLAALYMDHLGRIAEAWMALDTAFDSGYESTEWLVRMLAASLLLKKDESIDGLVWALKHNFDEGLGLSIRDKALEMAQNLAKKYSEGRQPIEKKDQNDRTDLGSTAIDDDSKADTANVKHVQPEKGPEYFTAQDEGSTRPGVPFLNFRFYDFHDFTLDFYQSPDVPDFVETFLEQWRRAVRDPGFATAGRSLRGSPFYFAQCPHCGVYVLTNRDIGKQIRCRMCEAQWNTEPIKKSDLEGIVATVSEAMGIKQASGESVVYLLIVQVPPDVDESVVRQICENAGMKELARDQMLAIELHREFIKRGATMETPWTVWMLEGVWDSAWAWDATPQKISVIVQELQSQIPGVRTMSSILPADEASELLQSIHDVLRQMEERCRAAIREGRACATDYIQLADILRQRGELKEAEGKARAAVAVDDESAEGWFTLGLILYKQNQFDEACEALEYSLSLSPNEILAMRFLALCYKELGDDERAKEMHVRAMSLSGGEFPWK